MNILITGAFGFVGTNLSAYLAEKKHELWALDVVEASRQDAKAQRSAYTRRFNWDELEEIPWGEVGAVIHLAGKAHDTRNTSDPQSYFDVNVGLTKRVLEAWASGNSGRDAESTEGRSLRPPSGRNGEGKKNGYGSIKKFILFSSVKAVADRVEGVLAEEAVPEPQTPYGQSKLEAEGVVRAVSGKSELGAISLGSALSSSLPEIVKPAHSVMEPLNQSAGCLNYYILRPCMIHGPGNKGNLNLLYSMVRRGVPWPLGAFENCRSFASIGNVCAVVEGLLAGEVSSGVYQVADDEPLSTNMLIELMGGALGRRVRIWKLPQGVVKAMARMGDVLHLPLNSERLKKLTESYVASNQKIKQALGWDQMPVGAREGMIRTLESFKQ